MLASIAATDGFGSEPISAASWSPHLVVTPFVTSTLARAVGSSKPKLIRHTPFESRFGYRDGSRSDFTFTLTEPDWENLHWGVSNRAQFTS